jgi:hypothetical protein
MFLDVEFLDQTTKSDPPVWHALNESKYTLGEYGVAIVWF